MNDGTFKVGEIAIFKNMPAPFSFMNGQECEITDEVKLRYVVDIHGTKDVCISHLVSFRGIVGAIPPSYLKKKLPPPKTLDSEFGTVVPWSDCAWVPNEVATV